MFTWNTAGHHEETGTQSEDPKSENSTSIEKKLVLDSKYPSQLVTRVLRKLPWTYGKPMQKAKLKTELKREVNGQNSKAPGYLNRPDL